MTSSNAPGVDIAGGKTRVESRGRSQERYGLFFPFVPLMFILALDDVTAVFPPQYSSSNVASLTAQLKMHENDYFICARVRNACSGFSSDHQGPVSIAGPLGSQRSHHTTPAASLYDSRSPSWGRFGPSAHICVCIHFRAVNTCVCACARFCVICGSAGVATLQWAGRRRPLLRGRL